MKKLLIISVLMLALLCIFTACNSNSDTNADSEDVITVEDGYLVVNGVKTQYEVNKADVITVEDGYLVVNGVKTEYEVELACDHDWQTVTTPPTCTENGYDIKTCSICNKSIKTNATEATSHKFSSNYVIDDEYHWLTCKVCGDIKDKGLHTPDEEGICTVCELPLSSTPGILYDVSTDGTYAEVISYNGTAAKVKIADEYNGLPVKAIYNNAFQYNRSITAVVIPDSVTSIGSAAFYYCSALNSIVIPSTVTNIASATFEGCSSLSSIVIPNSVTSIDTYAFKKCSNLSSITIPDSVTSIGYEAFYDCDSLSSIIIPDSVTNIGSYAFYDCSGLSSIEIGNGVMNISSYAFCGCSSLSSVVIPDSVMNIGAAAFRYCSNLSSVVVENSATSIEAGVFEYCHSSLYTNYEFGQYVGNADNPYAILIDITNKNMSSYTIHNNTKVIARAFSNCSRLTSITIPDSVTSIGSYAFHNCSSLSSIEIGNGVISIGPDAFYGCSNLSSIVIPDSATSIGPYAFSGCSSLRDVYYTGSESEWSAINIDTGNYDLIYASKHYNYVPEE